MIGKSHRSNCVTPACGPAPVSREARNCHFEVSAFPRTNFILDRSIRKTILLLEIPLGLWNKSMPIGCCTICPSFQSPLNNLIQRFNDKKAAGRKVPLPIPPMASSLPHPLLGRKDEIGGILGCTPEAVETRLHRPPGNRSQRSWPASFEPIGLLADSLVLISV
jgi:hypothetical protein